MKISGGWINCVQIGSGPYNYNDLQQHTWHIVGSTPNDIDHTFQPIHATWSVTGNGSKEYLGSSYSWIRQVLSADAPLQVWIAQDNMVHLARTNAGWNYPDGVTGTQTPPGGQPVTDGYPQPEIALPSMLTQWSPNLTGSFEWPYQRTDAIKIGNRIFNLKLPNRGRLDRNVAQTGWLWEPGPDSSGANPCHYLGLWHWEIDFA